MKTFSLIQKWFAIIRNWLNLLLQALVTSLSPSAINSHPYDDTTQTQKSVLTISEASVEYEGVYRCVAEFEDSATAESAAASLVIYS